MSKSRWTLFSFFMILSFVCCVSVFRLGAADPTSGTITPTSGPISWNGTAAGGAYNGEDTCVDGVNCDTYTLTVAGTPADWVGKRVRVTITWIVLSNDYDLYIHKDNNAGPVVASSAHGAPSALERADIKPSIDGTGVFSVHVGYFTGVAADEYHAVASVVDADAPPPSPPPISPDWTIVYHGTCCEGNLAAQGADTFVLLPELATGNDILKSSDGGETWAKKYPLADASEPFGIEGDLQAFGDDVIFFGTELADGVAAHSDDRGETWVTTQFPVPFVANDQAWSYLGPFGDIAPAGQTQLEPYVLAGWFRIGSVAVFSFDGGLTWPIQTPLVGDDGSGPIHTVCRNSAHDPTDPGDTRVANADFARKKAGRHGCWGTDRKFYWTEPADKQLYVCKTDNFGATWTGIKHPIAPGPAAEYVVTQSAFDNNGTFYVLHGNKLYVSFNQGESMAFVHTLPRWGDAERSDTGSDQFFVVDSGTIHIGLMEDAEVGNGKVYYLRGTGVDTAHPVWDEELVDVVGNDRLDFLQIVLNDNGIPTISYTTPNVEGQPDKEVTTASRNAPLSTTPARLLNISTRARVQTDDNVLIGGFIVTGAAPKKVIVRGIGPSLQANESPVPGRLEDPTLELFQQGNSVPVASNDNWKDNQAEVEATGLAPTNDLESAIVRTLDLGAYTAVLRGKDSSTGVGLVEAYDLGNDATSQLANISTRGFVETGDNVMIGGFIAGPSSTLPAKIVARGIGPSLKSRLPAAMDDPTLELRDANGTLIDSNDDWQQSSGAAQIQTVGLAPTNTAESAILVAPLATGSYTAILRGKGDTTGIGLVEIYNIP
jgi:hypothetical protein